MKNLRHIVLCIVGVFLINSCSRENYLDFQPRGLVIPSTIADYRSLLDQVNPSFGDELSRGFNERHIAITYLTDNQLLNDELLGFAATIRPYLRTYMFDDLIYNSLEEDEDWANNYNQIYTANVILNGLETITDGTQAEINELRAEALLHRAYAYFNLVNVYGLHYNPASANTDLGVPIREGIELEDLNLTRASVQSVYDYILNDINTSVDFLKDVQPVELSFRPSKAAAYGLLSKVYLYQSRYQEALGAVELALALKSELRDINRDSFSDNFPELRILPAPFNDEQIVWFKSDRTEIIATPNLLAQYEPDDLRLGWYEDILVIFGSTVTGKIYFAPDDNANYSNGINTPDLYLIRAECHTRLGNLDLANADLNALRENRFATSTYLPLNITEQTALLQFVKEERRREIVNSTERAFDIKRYNLFDGDNISLSHTINGQTFTLAPNSINWALPIAPRYIQLNPEIEQNPRE